MSKRCERCVAAGRGSMIGGALSPAEAAQLRPEQSVWVLRGHAAQSGVVQRVESHETMTYVFWQPPASSIDLLALERDVFTCEACALLAAEQRLEWLTDEVRVWRERFDEARAADGGE